MSKKNTQQVVEVVELAADEMGNVDSLSICACVHTLVKKGTKSANSSKPK